MARLTVQARLDQLIADGFDRSRAEGRDDSGRFSRAIYVHCSQCEALCINGIACHETGCPNTPREQDVDEDDYGVTADTLSEPE